ncbi:hypothetical protein [Novosphingobium percolationis]|uniref:hypothetical protein n=1 Tax=Novosphingobium percolationis TaxID=2871811 RepID=UPI001CD77ACB|nr:hypothetical protein [Novosphingobium percolationis]
MERRLQFGCSVALKIADFAQSLAGQFDQGVSSDGGDLQPISSQLGSISSISPAHL